MGSITEVMEQSVCNYNPDYSTSDAPSLAMYLPKPDCIMGRCDACNGPFKMLPPCSELHKSQRQIVFTEYEWAEVPTSKGSIFKQRQTVERKSTPKQFFQKFVQTVPKLLAHHFTNKGVKIQLAFLEKYLPAGVLLAHCDFPERLELFSKVGISELAYAKTKVLICLVAGALRQDPQGRVTHDLCIYLMPNFVSKDHALVQHCNKDAFRWAMGRTGINHIVVATDRARQEFSNATALLALSRQR